MKLSSEMLATLVERLAAIEHERWSHWQRFLHSQCRRGADGSLTIPAELVHRWEEQMATKYESLREEEKESDREQVHKYLPMILNLLGFEKAWLK
jgi:hypothetical protein